MEDKIYGTHRKWGHWAWKRGGWGGASSTLRRNHECFEIHLTKN